VKGKRDASGHVQWLEPVEGEPVRGVSAQDWAVVLDAMIGTTRCGAYCGTASAPFKDAAYQVAGKTGTAQVYTVAQNDKYNANTVPERLRDHAWFVAFAPADAPRIAVAVLVENAGFGAANAAPVARKVLDAYLLGPDGKLKPATLEAAAPAQPALAAPAASTANPTKPQA
jgi:penicillin-binding protein 2